MKKNYRITGVMKGKYELRDESNKFLIVDKRTLDKLKKTSNFKTDF